jgi:hypothetical protein
MILALLTLACTTTTTSEPPVCILDTPVATPASGAPGATVVLTTSPVTAVWDTAVTVGDQRAEIVSVDRTDCDECDSCRESESCTVCGECDACTASCASCVESVSFLVPGVSPGVWPLETINRHGRSPSVSFEVLGTDTGVDTGTDTGTDTGVDTGTDTGVDTGTDSGA